ncbi:MAG TPA: biopolymer transporter ExbD [Opitutaceae bacterium]|nr:biopolymer transporter ExbD [Opitutaceae bacterium]
MARTFRRHRSSHPLADLNVTNLVDLAFVLLLIFMMTAPLMTPEQGIPLNLPFESKSTQQVDSKQRFQVVAVDKQGNFYFGTTPLSLDELGRRLAALGAEPEDRRPVIRIRADLSLQWQEVVRVMDLLKKANLSKIVFDTQTEP